MFLSCFFFKFNFSNRFDVTQDCFFTASVRSRIVQFILDRKRFCRENCNDYAFGIERLISDQVYIAAYPLHDVSKSLHE
jgi:anoctamin-1